MARRDRRAMTLVEVLVAALLLLVLVGFIARAGRVQVLAWFAVEHLDSLHQIRLARARVIPVLDTSTEILHPQEGEEAASFMVVADSTYRPRLVYLNRDGTLTLLDVDGASTPLVEGVESFSVQQPMRGQVSCRLVIVDPRERRARTPISLEVTVANHHGGLGIGGGS